MRRFATILFALAALAICVPEAEAQSRSRYGGGSFGQSFTRGLGFSLGARVGGFGFGGPFGSAGFVQPFRSFHDPFAFRQPVFFQYPLVVRPAVRFIQQPLVIQEQHEAIELPGRTERIIIIR